MPKKTAGVHHGTAGNTHGTIPSTHVVCMCESHSVGNKFVEVRGYHFFVAKCINGVVTLVVGKNKNDVRLLLLCALFVLTA
jgi:hypothetical protein